MSKERDRHKQFINQLCYEGEKVIKSEVFRDLHYIIKDGQICLISRENGVFTVAFEALNDLKAEIEEIAEVWGNIKTKKCLL